MQLLGGWVGDVVLEASKHRTESSQRASWEMTYKWIVMGNSICCRSFPYIENNQWIFSMDCNDQPNSNCLFSIAIWLVVWNMIFIFPYIGNVIIPTDEFIFFRGVGIPPTSFCLITKGYMILQAIHAMWSRTSRSSRSSRWQIWRFARFFYRQPRGL